MPIVKDGNGVIQYTAPEKERELQETGVARDNDFAIADKNNVLKQVQWDINPLSAGSGVLTLQCDIDTDSTLNITSLAAEATSQAANKILAGPTSGIAALPTFRSLVAADLPAGTGTVSSVSVVSANGLAGTVATATTTPAITLSTSITGILKGNGTAISAASSGTDYLSGTLTNAHILVGNGSNIATDVAVSGDISLANTGAMTVSTVGASSAANIHSAELAANAATSANTASTIVKRDASGNFSAGTITANLTGNASGTAASVTGIVDLAHGGTNSSSFTAGSIPFVNAPATAITENNTDLLWDNTNKVLKLQASNIQLGSADPFARTQIWNKASNSVLRQGAWQADGDSSSVTSEGIVIYGDSLSGNAISPSNGSYGRVKNNRFGLFTIDSTYSISGYYFRVDDTELFLADNTLTKKFTVTRTTGAIKTSMGAGIVHSDSSGNLTSSAVSLTADVSGTLPIANGGTGQTSATAAFDALSPMTTLGDTIYGGASGTRTRLAGNTTSTRKFLRQVGDGVNSAAPAWDTLVSGDIPALAYASSTLTNAHIFVGNGSNVATDVAVSGDVTLANTGAITIANNAVTNAKAAQMAAHTFKGNNTGSTANASDLTAIQLSNELIIATQAISSTSIDWSTGNVFSKTLGANTTFTFTGQVSGQIISVRLTNTASNYTVTWPTVRWVGGTPPTMTVGAFSDVYTFVYDGSNIYGSYVQNLS